MTQTLTRTQAARTARITRVAAAVIGAGAVALAVAGLPERADPPRSGSPGVPPGAQQPTPAAAEGGETRVRWAPVDTGGMAARLSLVGNAPKIERPGETVSFQETPEETGPLDDDRAAAGIADRVRYMGLIRFGEERGALVRVDGRQRIVREGGSVAPPADSPGMSALTFERIAAGTVVVSDGEGRAPVALERRRGPSVTMAEGGVVDPGEQADEQAGGNQESNPRNIPQRELDRRQRMIERQRSGQLGNNTRSAIQRPPVNRTFDMRNRRNDDQRDDQDR